MQTLRRQQAGKGDGWIDLDNERDDVSSCEGALRVTLNSRCDAQVMYAQHRTVQVSDNRPKPINQLGWYVPSTSKFLHGTSSKGESRPQFNRQRWEHGEAMDTGVRSSKFCEGKVTNFPNCASWLVVPCRYLF